MRKSKKSGIVFVVKFNKVNVKYRSLFFVPARMLHIVNFASNTINWRPRYSRSDSGPILRIHEKIKKKIRIVFVVIFIKVNVEYRFLFFVPTRMLHLVNFASKLINGRPQHSRSDFGPILRIHEKIKKSVFVFVVKFNKVNVEYRFLFFVPTRMLHVVNFASNTINGSPRYSRSDFGPILRIHEKIKESGNAFVVKFIKVNVEYRFLFFVPTRMLHVVNFASNTINGSPRYSRSDFGPILRIHEKIKESGNAFVVKFIKVNVEYRFLFFVPTRMLHIVNFASNTINGSPRYSRSDFGPILRIHEKVKESGNAFVVKFNEVNVKYRFFIPRSHKIVSYC